MRSDYFMFSCKSFAGRTGSGALYSTRLAPWPLLIATDGPQGERNNTLGLPVAHRNQREIGQTPVANSNVPSRC